MKKKLQKLQKLYIERDDLLEAMDEIEKNINTVTIPNLKDVSKTVKNEDVLKNNVLFSELNLKSDSEFFTRLLNATERYSKALPVLKKKINDELPDTFSASTSNINTKLALSLVSEGIFLADTVTDIIAYMINKFYTKSGTEIEKSTNAKLSRKLIFLIQVLPELEKAKFDSLVDIIGNVPTIKTLRQEDTSIIPMDVVMGFMTNTFKISDRYTIGLIRRALGFFNGGSKASKSHAAIGYGFIGNPIYHIRLFLIDLEQLRFEKLKESKRLMELRILELKQKDADNHDEKLEKAIKYYEEKLNKLDMKMERYLRG